MKCPICGTKMKESGKIKPINKYGRDRTRPVYRCPKCNHRTMK